MEAADFIAIKNLSAIIPEPVTQQAVKAYAADGPRLVSGDRL